MKQGKQILSLVLVLLLLCGIPMSVSAVGTAAPTEMKLTGAMPITSDIRVGSALHTSDAWGDKGLAVFFNQPVPASIGSTRCYIVVVDANNQVVNYNGTDLIWSTNRSTAELWQIRGNFLALNMSITIGGKSVNTWTSLAEALTTELANRDYRLQLRMMGVSGEVTDNNYVDTVVNNGQKLAANLKVASNSSPINGGSTDCYYVDIGTAVAASGTQNAYIKPTQMVTLDKVAMTNLKDLVLTFSQAVTIDTARNDAVLEIVSADGTTISNSYDVTLTEGNTATVNASLTTSNWVQIQTDLAAAASGSYVRFKMTEKEINTAYGENQFNFVVDTVWGKDDYRPLRSNTGAAAQYAHDFVLCPVEEPSSLLTLDKAQALTIAEEDYVVLTFSHPVTVASARYFCLRKISASADSSGQPVDGINVTLDYQGYYGTSSKQILTKLRSGSIADIRTQAGTLGDTYRLVVMTIDKVDTANTPDGYEVDSISATQDPSVKLTANLSSSTEDRTVVDLDEESFDSISVESVYIHNERNLLVTFDRAVVAQPNLYSAIRLVDDNNTLYCADSNTGGATVYSAGSSDTATKYLQWQVSAVTLNGTGASQYSAYGTSGCQLLGTLGINYSKLLEIEQDAEAWFAAQGTSKDLHLRLCFEEKNVSTDYGIITSANHVVDSVYATDKSSFLPVSVGNANGHYAEVTGVVNDTLADRLAAAESGDTVSLVGNETVTDIRIPEGVTLDLAGCTLTANNVVSFGDVKDSALTKGGIAIAKNDTADKSHLLTLTQTNSMLPLYDESKDCYRFYTCTLNHMVDANTNGKGYRFGFQLEMDEDAYALLVNSDGDEKLDADIQLLTDMSIDVDSGEKTASVPGYDFNAGTLADYGTKKQDGTNTNWAVILKVIGFDGVTFDEGITVTSSAPIVKSSTGVEIKPAVADSSKSFTYTK